MTEIESEEFEPGIQDNLEEIDGIASFFAETLRKSGIYTFADLAKYDSFEDLQQDILNKAGVKIKLWQIKCDHLDSGSWIKQAKEKRNSGKRNSPIKKLGKYSSSEWEEYVGFMIFFDTKIDDEKRIWQTRVYRTENGEHDEFPGVEPDRWVNWIFEHAQLPTNLISHPIQIDASSFATETEITIETPDFFDLNIRSVEIFEDPGSSILEKKLIAKVDFEFSGSGASKLLDEQSSYLIELWMINIEEKSRHRVAWVNNFFKTNKFEDVIEIKLAMPPAGRYELHTILLLRPPYESLAAYTGPIINIVPQSLNLEAVAV